MAVDRNTLEQKAMRLLERGRTQQALDTYLQILRQDPRNRRLRKTIAELHLRLGQNKEAERRFLEVVEALRKDGQDRAAIPIYQQLIPLRPKDHQMVNEQGDCYLAAGFPNDARQCYERAVEMTARLKPDQAQEIQGKIVRLAPGEMPVRVRQAELLEAANWSERAFNAWCALGTESARLGRPDDQVRFLERALTLRQEWGAVVDLAEAKIKAGDARGALVLLQQALQERKDVRIIALFGAAVQAVGQPAKAKQLWQQAARMYAEADDVENRAKALRAALECAGGRDAAIEAELKEADATLAQMSLRLDAQEWARPRSEREVEVVIRARVQADYGFPDRARQTLEGAADIRKVASVQAMLVEVLAMLGDDAAAISELSQVRPESIAGRQQVATRLAILRGETPPDGDEIIEDEFIDDDEMLDDDDDLLDDDDMLDEDDPTPVPTRAAPARSTRGGSSGSGGESAEARGDTLARQGNLRGAAAAYREAMDADPNNEDVLFKLGDVMAMMEDDEPAPAPEPASGGFSFGDTTFAEVSPDDMDLGPSSSFDDGFDDGFGGAPARKERPLDPQLLQARGRISVGMFREAAPFLKGRTDLPAQVLIARIWLEVGDLRKARNILRGAVGQADKSGEDYLEALWTLVDVYTRAKKPDAALHMIEEIEAADRGWRRWMIRDRRAGLEVMLGQR